MTTQEEKDRSSSTLARGRHLKKKANANETGTYASSAWGRSLHKQRQFPKKKYIVG